MRDRITNNRGKKSKIQKQLKKTLIDFTFLEKKGMKIHRNEKKKESIHT